MKPWIKILIAGIIGFGGGFASGFFAHKKMNDVQFEEISAEEMQEIEAAAAKKETIEASIDRTFETVKDIQELPEDEEELRRALQGKTPYIQADAEQKKAYEKMWEATREYSGEANANDIPVVTSEGVNPEGESEEDDEGFDDDFMEEIADEEPDDDEYTHAPYRITMAEFFNERPDFDKITIYYYEADGVWLDEKEEEIEDIDSYIGSNAKTLYSYAMPGDEEDVRFIRNEEYHTDYEIIRHKRSLQETENDER